MSNRLSRDLWVIPVIALLVMLVAGPFWQIDGIPINTRDVQVHLHRGAAMERSFEQGVYWPRWLPDVYNGLGSPLFNHYSPGLYWSVAALHRLGLALDQALKLVLTAALALSGFSVYSWLRHAFSGEASLTATSLFLLHPSLLTQTVYYGGDFPQMLALLLLPACFWAFTALHRRQHAGLWVAAIAAAVALVLSHNLIAMVGAFSLFVCMLLLAFGYRRTDGLLRCAIAAAVAALLSAAFWLPALGDLPLVQTENAQSGVSKLGSLFLHWWQFTGVQSPILDSRAGNPLRPINTFGAAAWLALFGGLLSVTFARGKERRGWTILGAAFALVMLIMASAVSRVLWETVPGVNLFLFPSRFLLIAPLGALPAAALMVDAWRKHRWLPGLVSVSAAVLVLFPYLFPSHTPMFSPLKSVKELNPQEALAYEPYANAWGLTSYNEFLVRGADMSLITGKTEEPEAAELTWVSPHEAVADVSNREAPVLLRMHFHPGWSAGEQATLQRGPAAWMQVSKLHDAAQPLLIRWVGTSWQRLGERMSLLGLVATLAGALFFALRRRNSAHAISDIPVSSTRTAGVLTVCLLVFVAVRYALDLSHRGPFLLHSPPGQLAFAVEGQPTTLGDEESGQVTLLGWKLLSSKMPGPGDTVSVRFYWQAHAELPDDYHTFLHLHTPAIQRSWAVENLGVLRPPTRVWDPQKYYIETMRLSLPEDIPPLTYALVAGMVSTSGERLLVPGSVNDLVELREMAVTPLRPGYLQSERPLVAADAATGDALRLQGYDLVPRSEQPDHLTLRLFWETGNGPTRDWITYIHLTDSQGNVAAQFDGPALAGLEPTSSWHTDALYIDRREIDLPAELAPGDYLFRIGLYSFETGERLPFEPDDDETTSFENGQLLIPLRLPLPVHDSD